MTSIRRLDGILAAATAVSAILFFTAAFATFNQNDFMYATAPIFWGRLTLYRDLMFVQAPGSVAIYGLIYQAVGPADFYLALRFFCLAVLLLACLLTFQLSRRMAGGRPAIMALAFLLISPFVASIAVDSGSTSLALLGLICAVYVYIARPCGVRTAAATGLAIGLAATMKLNFALYAIPFGLFIARRAGLRSREAAAYGAGGVIGASMIWYYLLTDFSHFWFFNIRFHALMNIWREAHGETVAPVLVIATILFALYAGPVLYLGYKAIRTTDSPDERRRLGELGGLLATSLAAAFSPIYYAPQYLAAPVFLLTIGFAFALNILDRGDETTQRTAWRLAWAAVAALGALFWVQTLPPLARSVMSNTASIPRIRAVRHRIQALASSHLAGTPCNMAAISFSPLPLLGTAFDIAPLSASGPFLPMLTAQIQQNAPAFAQYAFTADALDQAKATAFLVGYFPTIVAEQMLVAYARAKDFVAFDVGRLPERSWRDAPPKMRLLIRRSCMTRPPSPSPARQRGAAPGFTTR